MVRSIDAGASWFQCSDQNCPRGTLTDVLFIDENTGWISGFPGQILHTTDGGSSWTGQRTPTHGAILKIKMVKGGVGFAAVGGNGILKTISGGNVSSINERVYSTPASPELLQNFPNPFNPTTTIRYTLPERTRVRMEVFNTLGQMVARIDDGVKNADEHDVRFDAKGFPSGVYLCRLIAGGYFGVRPIVLLK